MAESLASSSVRQHLGAKRASQPAPVVLVIRGSAKARAYGVSAIAKAGGRVRHQLPALGTFSVAVSPRDASRVLASLQSIPGLEVSLPHRRFLQEQPDDALYSHQSIYYGLIHAPQAWDATHGSSTVSVAVIDSGVDIGHPDLASKISATYNAVDGSADVSDSMGHGTFIAGVVGAATGNGSGVAGMGWNTTVTAVKVANAAGEFFTDDESAGIVWAADHGARVVSVSLGGAVADSVEQAAVQYAQSKNVLVVAAAGNAGSTAKTYPAAYTDVLAVGSVSLTGSRSTFSNHGPWVDVAAPGENVYSTTPTAGSADFLSPNYDSGDGTSFSTPLVAGEAALLLSLAPSSSAAQLARAITASARDKLANLDMGSGLVDVAGAIAELPPRSQPAVDAPAGSSTVGGITPVSVSSIAGAVQLYLDGAAVGAQVPVMNGRAESSLDTWGVPDGPHTIAAADCDQHGCGARTSVPVQVVNDLPRITSPGSGPLSGDIRLAASSGAGRLRFRVDGKQIGALVPIISGDGSTTWSSWGLVNGLHQLEVAACSSTSCGNTVTAALTLENRAPAISTPRTGAVVQGTLSITASVGGGAIRFLVDGIRRGPVVLSPYRTSLDVSSLADGQHALTAVSCTLSGACAGPTSDVVTFSTLALHPNITSASPVVFSPNGDGRLDTTTLTLRLPDRESASWRVVSSSGAAVTAPRALGLVAAGDHRFTWNGRNAAGNRAADATYRVVVTTTASVSGVTLHGTASRTVRVDTRAPVLAAVTGTGATVYPVIDGFHDSIPLTVRLDEASRVTTTIINSAGGVVRTLVGSVAAPSTFRTSWNGRTASGSLLPAGTYRFSMISQDAASNRRTTNRFSVALSSKRLVTKTASVLKTGNQYTSAYGTAACAGPDTSASDYSAGVWLDNACDPYYDGNQFVIAEYSFTLPVAVRYTSLRFDALGYSLFAPSLLLGDSYNFSTGGYDSAGGVEASSAKAWRTLSRPAVAGHVSGRTVRFAAAVADDSSGSADYDIDSVRVVVAYQVLQ